MDSNNTRFHLLFGRDDWKRAYLEDGTTTLREVWAADEADSPPPGAEGVADTAGWLDPRTQDLTLRPRLARFAPSTGDRPVQPADRHGAARDRYGNWYVVSDDRASLSIRSIGSDEVSPFWPPAPDTTSATHESSPGDFAPDGDAPAMGACFFGGLVVTRDHHLVATSTVDGRTEILVFDLFAGGSPWRLRWPADVSLDVWDLAPREPGGFWLLDRTGRRLWEFNTYFQVVRPPWVVPPGPDAQDFSAVAEDGITPLPARGTEPGSACCAVARVTIDHAMPLAEVDPIAVEPLPGGGALILDRQEPSGRIGAYRNFTRTGGDSLDEILDVIDDDLAGTWGLVPHDFAVVTEPSTDLWLDSTLRAPLLFVVDRAGNQAFCFELAVSDAGAPHLTATAQFVPMRLFGGRALVATDGRAYYDGFGARFVPLVAQERPRYEETAIVITAPLDGDAPGCVWHRILFEGCIPSDTKVRIATRATDADGTEISNDEGRATVFAALDRLPWDENEPEPVLRASGCELPWLRAEAVGDRATWELLVQRARGRYLQVRLTLEGDGRRSPRIRALRVYFPRFSYLAHYLPACYRDDAVSASFLDRLLANHEGLVTALEDRALALGTLCDPSATPAELLDWLGRWYAVYLDPAWPPARKRLFLRHALTFFQWRGTARGLRAAMRLAFDECLGDSIFTEEGDRSDDAQRFRIVEDFRVRALPNTRVVEREPCPGIDETQSTESLWWKPADGLEALNRRWRIATGATSGSYPLTAPDGTTAEATWTTFSESTLGFVPENGTGDAATWRTFLRCRYSSFEDAVSAWGTAFDESWDSFADVEPPEALPSNTDALDDWVVFHRYVRPMRAAAHRFSVSLPVQPQRARDTSLLRVQLHLADRLIALEKPAHTAYRVRLYWAMFRVGEARLGLDTQIGQGSRLPELLPPFVLGEGALAEGRLAPRPEDWARRRTQLGRNPLRRIARPIRCAPLSPP